MISEETQPAGYFDKTVLKIKDTEKINRLGKYWHWAVKERWSVELLKKRLNEPMSDEEMDAMTAKAQAECKKELYGL